MLREANILDIPSIINLLSITYGEENMEGAEWYYSNKIKNRFDTLYLLNKDNSVLFMFERVGNFKCQLHTYTNKKVGGKAITELFKESIKYLKYNTTYSCVITFVPMSNKAADRGTRYVGFTKIGSISSAGGYGNNETLYYMEIK